MKTTFLLIGAAFLSLTSAFSAAPPEIEAASAADEPTIISQPPAFVMSIACFSDTFTTKPEWIFVVGGTAFRSLEALKSSITRFPKGSTLTWRPSGKGVAGLGEPLSSDEDRKAFAAHCDSHGIRFILVPAM